MKQKLLSRKKFIITLVVVGVLFYILNLLTPMMLDDHDYSFNFTSFLRVNNWDRNQNLFDIFESLRHHYIYSNGRLVVHFFAFLFCMLGKNVFNVFNTIAFLLLGLVIYYHAKGSIKAVNTKALIFIYIMLFFVAPDFGQSFLWMVGACNYLWGTLIVLTFMLPFKKIAMKSKNESTGAIKTFLMALLAFVFGIIAGACNENAGAMLIFTLPAFLYFYKKHGINRRPWMYAGWLGSIIGIASIIVSPGQQTRLSNSGGSGLSMWIKNIFKYSYYLVKYCWLLLLFIAILLIVYFVKQRKNNKDYNINSLIVDTEESKEGRIFLKAFGEPLVYAFAAIVSVYSMIVSPDFPKRAWVLTICLLIIIIFQLYDRIKYSFTVEQVESRMATLVLGLMVISIFVYISAVRSLYTVDAQWQDRMEIFQEAKENGQSEVTVPKISSDSRYSCYPEFGDLKEDADLWPNTVFEEYYGIEKIYGE